MHNTEKRDPSPTNTKQKPCDQSRHKGRVDTRKREQVSCYVGRVVCFFFQYARQQIHKCTDPNHIQEDGTAFPQFATPQNLKKRNRAQGLWRPTPHPPNPLSKNQDISFLQQDFNGGCSSQGMHFCLLSHVAGYHQEPAGAEVARTCRMADTCPAYLGRRG